LLPLESLSGEFLPAALLLFGLALVSLIGVFVPRIRNFWRWGRTAENAPISRFGCSVISVAFFIMGSAPAGLALGWVAGMNATLMLLTGFVLFIVAGALDFRKANQR
jgi:hypothetical protein